MIPGSMTRDNGQDPRPVSDMLKTRIEIVMYVFRNYSGELRMIEVGTQANFSQERSNFV